jgi:hypothetical protein
VVVLVTQQPNNPTISFWRSIMHLIPLRMAKMADVCSSDSGRFATNGIKVWLHDDGGFRMAATDCLRLIEYTSPPSETRADEFPRWDALKAAPNGAKNAIIPAPAFKQFFGDAAKIIPKRLGSNKAIGHVAVVLGKEQTTFAATDLERRKLESVAHVDGKFVPVDDIWPTKRPAVVVRFDANLMANTLKTIAALVQQPEGPWVELEIINPFKAISLRAVGDDGGELRAIVMPHTPEKSERSKPSCWVNRGRVGEGVAEQTEAMAALERENSILTQERNHVQELLETTATECREERAARVEAEQEVQRLTLELRQAEHAINTLSHLPPDQVFPTEQTLLDRIAELESINATLATNLRCVENTARQLAEERGHLQAALYQRSTSPAIVAAPPMTRAERLALNRQ